MKKYITLIAITLFSLIVISSNGQQNDTLKIQRNDHGIVNFAHFKPNSDRKIQDGSNFLKTFLHAKTGDEFRLIKETTDELGISHLRFQQYYNGVKVENSEYLIHGKNGIIETINGDFKHVILPTVTPSLNEKHALNKALEYVHAKKYKWEDEAYEKFKKERTGNPDATYYPKGELVIVRDYLTGSKQMKLAWKFTISSSEPFNEQWIYIDAINGEVIGNTPLLLDSNTSGSAETLYSGTAGITCDSYSGGYRLSETRTSTPNHTVNIHTWNCLSQSNLTNAVEFSNSNTNWTTGSWPAISQDQAALDAHWAEEKVLDYWSSVHARNSLNDQGLSITGYVHFYKTNTSTGWPNNAAWDPTDDVMLYGDGDGGTNFFPLAALDVVAHEMGHGITQFTAGLTPGTQESGALNEGFSDIWGASVEHWAAPNKQTWLIGEEIVNPIFTCLRNMQNPKSVTAKEGQHPDTYLGDFWDPNGEPHCNSTVLSHWFYLLAQGSNGNDTNDNTDCFNVSSIGIDDAQRIAFRTEKNLQSSATYADARNVSIDAASYLFGANSNQVVQTTNAWYAVGVGDEYFYEISGPTTVCSSGTTFSVNYIPSGCSVSWNKSSNLSTGSTTGNPKVFTATGTGTGWIEATIINPTCGNNTLPRKDVWLGLVDENKIVSSRAGQAIGAWAQYHILCSSGYTAVLAGYDTNQDGEPFGDGGVESGSIIGYDWNFPSGWSFYDTYQGKPNEQIQVSPTWGTPQPGQMLQVGVRAQNGCGWTNWKYDYWQVISCSSYMTLSPNPATDITIIEIVDASDQTAGQDPEWTLQIFDQTQQLKEKLTNLKGKKYQLNTSNWKEGVYIVRANYNGELLTNKLVVKR